MAWETQGPVADRTRERLATTDRGIAMLRDLLRREIEKVRRGEDPMGVMRSPEHPMIDTNVDEGVRQMQGDARSAGAQGPRGDSTAYG
jgi:5,5'-dehydrodivanillate O-demethylase